MMRIYTNTHVSWGNIDATEEPRRAASDSQQCISKALSLLDEVSTSIPSATPFGRPAAVRRSKLQSPNDGFLTRFPEWQTPGPESNCYDVRLS